MFNRNINSAKERVHLKHLDGLRGLTALYVVFHHAFEDFRPPYHGNGLPSWLRHLIKLTEFGQAAVAIFIVLSGYCLMMPLVQTNTTYLRDGVFEYIKRRARRILPPYYAAIGVSLLLIATIPAMNQKSNTLWDASLPAFHVDNILSHLLLVHNLSKSWAHKIGYQLWSVATEWQIYFVFALILLPLWRRLGPVFTVIFAIIIGISPHWLFHKKVDVATFEYIGLFAFGMAGAALSFPARSPESENSSRNPWGILALLFLFIAYFGKFRANGDWNHLLLSNIVIGLSTTCLLIYCVLSLSNTDRKYTPFIVKLLNAKSCVYLGSFSYSLYLIHAPVLALFKIVTRYSDLSEIDSAALSFFIAIPLCVITSYLFFLAFEKPFLVKSKRNQPPEIRQ